MAEFSTSIGEPQPSVLQVALDNTRRIFNFGDRVATLTPQETPFFTYSARLRRNPTDDPVFKMQEERSQWQRRNFNVETAFAATTFNAGSPTISGLKLGAKYDKYGRETTTYQQPIFLLANQVIVVEAEFSSDGGATWSAPTPVHLLITEVSNPTASNVSVNGKILAIGGSSDLSTYNGQQIRFSKDARGQVIGTAFPEASKYPASFRDELLPTEGYCQIFKTASPMFSRTALATRYRGRPNEFLRVWTNKLREHKIDIEHALLFGVGRVEGPEDGLEPKRYTWGVVPYISLYGVVQNMTYASSSYNDFIDFLEYFYAPERGGYKMKLWMASRKVISWLNKMGAGSFLGNTLANSLQVQIEYVQGAFGHKLMQISTIFGDVKVVEQPLLRGIYEDYLVCVDLENVAYRPLVGNGISRDTFIETNVQDPGVDARIDQIITEAGLEITLPETHAIIKFS